jgi:uncharacterized protein (TIGR02444 family)
MTDAPSDFRRFAVDLYATTGVANAAMLLQDQCDVDVNLLLLAAFVGAVDRAAFTEHDFDTAHDRTRQWQAEVVVPLRAVRRRLKSGPMPAPGPASTELRARVQAVELDAELVELDVLATLLTELRLPAAAGTPGALAHAALTVVVRACAQRELTGDEQSAVSVIATAAARLGPGYDTDQQGATT